MNCNHGLPPGSTYSHCSVCCRTFTTLGYFDGHRSNGRCRIPKDVYELDGLWSTEEGHEKRRAVGERLKMARAARKRAAS